VSLLQSLSRVGHVAGFVMVGERWRSYTLPGIKEAFFLYLMGEWFSLLMQIFLLTSPVFAITLQDTSLLTSDE